MERLEKLRLISLGYKRLSNERGMYKIMKCVEKVNRTILFGLTGKERHTLNQRP